MPEANDKKTRYEVQRKAFEFFTSHLESKEPFTKEDLAEVTNWKEKTLDTYWTKQFRPFIIELGGGCYRVSEAFRRYATWDRFREHVTQVRRPARSADYQHHIYEKVLVYEFFMPLTNEAHLRNALDALFFRDSVESRLKTIPENLRRLHFPAADGEDTAHHLNRLCNWISSKFVGYSIYHVSGRFRADELKSKQDALKSPRYIIDETTAVTRFIFPCIDEVEARRIAFFFNELFIKAIIEVVSGEDEIWMVETGLSNRLHIWRVN